MSEWASLKYKERQVGEKKNTDGKQTISKPKMRQSMPKYPKYAKVQGSTKNYIKVKPY